MDNSVVLEGWPRADFSTRKKPCRCTTTENKQVNCHIDHSAYPRRLGDTSVYNFQVIKNDTTITKAAAADKGKDCTCFPTDPIRPCKTLDCECITLDKEAFTRRIHKPFCPSYKHKEACPVSHLNDEVLNPGVDPSLTQAPLPTEEEAPPLPYGLPPVTVGPCPVPGRPCRTDSAARLLKIQPQTLQAPKDVPGKVSVSKEFERIKKAMLDFQAEINYKRDFICLHKTNVDTEKRCCDDDQRLLNLIGKSCCAEHKLAAQTLYKEQAEREASEKRNSMPPY
ncbi:hypothetical protein O0L34_g1045 [Tuta absoluta]|nr:hypothetical protein O0L34_g1045 [Tuta absoluta]